MIIEKCDICNKNIKDKPIRIRWGFYKSSDLCLDCGKPILEFLKKNKLIKEEK